MLIASVLYLASSVTSANLHGWVFPGRPGCAAPTIIQQYGLDSVNVEYMTIGNANILQLNEIDYGCNAYSPR